jgi:hypothetical protein
MFFTDLHLGVLDILWFRRLSFVGIGHWARIFDPLSEGIGGQI